MAHKADDVSFRCGRPAARARAGHRALGVERHEDTDGAWRLVAATMADPSFETKVPFVVKISVGRTWSDCEEALEIGGAAPWLPSFEQDADVRASERELAMAQE